MDGFTLKPVDKTTIRAEVESRSLMRNVTVHLKVKGFKVDKAYLVLGPESSGTRLTTRILINNGCAGSDQHLQPFDMGIPEDVHGPIVWRRSLPHNGQWDCPEKLIEKLVMGNRGVITIACMRSVHAIAMSQVTKNHVFDSDGARQHIRKAYCKIFEACSPTMVSYEAMILNPIEEQRALIASLRLTWCKFTPVHNGNSKHWARTSGAERYLADLVP